MSARRRSLIVMLGGALVAGAVAFAQDQPAPPRGNEPAGGRDAAAAERRPDVMGRVAAVSPDGRTLTINVPPRPAGDGQPPPRDARPEPTQVIVTDRTKLLFFGVGDGEARLMPGQMAMVWLADGSRNEAARVRLMKREGEDRPDVQGRVVGVSPDGKTLTVEQREGDRVTGKTDVRLAPYTQTLYYGVDRDGAKPTPDYLVVAWLEKGSKDTAMRVRFTKNDPSASALPR
jgi:hypothetical protein